MKKVINLLNSNEYEINAFLTATVNTKKINEIILTQKANVNCQTTINNQKQSYMQCVALQCL